MSTSEKCEFYSTMQKTPQGLMRNIDKLNSTQQTKRRVINGFVGEMSLELAESE